MEMTLNRVPEKVKEVRVVRGPRLSSLSQTLNWIFCPLNFMDRSRDQIGDVFAVRVLGWARLVLVSDPELVKEIFSFDAEVLQTGKANDLMSPVVGDHSVFLLDGTVHRQVRRILINAFNIEASRRAALFSAQRAVEIVKERCDGRYHDVHCIFSEVALGTMLYALFGLSERTRVKEYANRFSLILGGLSPYFAYLRFLQKDFGPGTPGWWIRTEMAKVHALIERDLARAKDTEAGESPAQSIRDTLSAIGKGDMVVDQLVSLLVAGHDTVASALAWCVYWLLRKPALIDTLRQEGRVTHGGSMGDRTSLIDAVCLEALRLIPTVEIVSREAMRDVHIGGYLIEKGTLVSPCVYLLHRNKALYPNPTHFIPERFLQRQFAPYEFIPFGGGTRRCLGATLGLLEMRAVMAALLSTF
jgi:cytochrome P450 family 110